MANYVKVATVSPRYVMDQPPKDADASVQWMIDYWRQQIACVLPDRPDLIIVPECCDRFAVQTNQQIIDYYRHRGNRVRDAFAQIARENHCYLTYSAVHEVEDGSFRNAVQLLDRAGDVCGEYRKNHVVVEETTQGGILCGSEPTVIETDFGRVGFAICFDLNFDPLRLQYKALRPDMIVFSSMYHGGLMQRYWAYSCRCHLATSVPGMPSGVINPVGETIAMTTNYYPFRTVPVNLDCAVVHIDYNGARFPDIKRKYGEKVSIFDPGCLGSVLISSETDDFSIDRIIDEFELERLDDYFERALAHHNNPANIEGGQPRKLVGVGM